MSHDKQVLHNKQVSTIKTNVNDKPVSREKQESTFRFILYSFIANIKKHLS